MKLYIFIGMFDGINEVIEPYVNENDAKKAWSEYMEMDYSEYEKDSSILDYSKHLGTAIYESEAPLECYDPTCQIAIKWDIDDVKNVRTDLTDEQCMEVLEQVRHKHDAEIGVSWVTLESWADILFPLPPKKMITKN